MPLWHLYYNNISIDLQSIIVANPIHSDYNIGTNCPTVCRPVPFRWFESCQKETKSEPPRQRRFGLWSEWRDSNTRHPGPKPMSEPSARTLAPSLALSVAPTVPLWNSIGLFISAIAFVFWDLYGMKFCILKVLPTGFGSGGGHFCHSEQLRNCVA